MDEFAIAAAGCCGTFAAVTAPPPGAPVAAAAVSSTGLTGRDRELCQLGEALADLRDGPRLVVIRGEMGIGKSALWQAGVDHARRMGAVTLVARAAEDELPAPVVGLVDLFEGIDGSDSALAPGIGLSERGRAAVEVLRRSSSASPVVLAIDDVQWLDPVSAAAIRFAVRRLTAEPILLLVTLRCDPSTEQAGILGDVIGSPARRLDIALGPLHADDIRAVVAPIALSMTRRALDELCALSGGNPMYAIEIARAADRLGAADALIPPTLHDVVATRLAGIGPDEMNVLRVAALLGPGSPDLLARAMPGAAVARAIDAAVAHGWLIRDENVLRFAHPLVASTVAAGVNPIERQTLHARLAEVVDDADARARHLALSCAEPDAAIASELSAAARRAARAGARAFAAELAAHAVRVTPPADVATRVRRQFVAILHRAAAGDRAMALSDTDALVAALPAGPVRAEAVSLRVALDFAGGDRYLDQALSEAGTDELLRGRILELRGWMEMTYRAAPTAGERFCEQALEIATGLQDPRLEMLAAGSVATASLMLGRPRPELLERALRLAAEHPGPALGRWPQGVAGQLAVWCGQLDRARLLLEDLYRTCETAGMEFQRPYRLLDLAMLELACGHPIAAAELAEDGCASAADARNEQATAWLAYPAGLAAVHLGDGSRAAELASVLRSRGTEHDGRTRALMASHVLGLNALAGGNAAAAVAVLEPAVRALRDIGLQLPSVLPALPDAIEAAAAAGDLRLCHELSAELTGQAEVVGQPWVTAAARRGRGLAALAAGDMSAPGLLADAADEFERLGYRLDAARTRLHQARAMRRSGGRIAAEAVLERARDGLRQMLASGWLPSPQADRNEAVAFGGVPLTPTESRISDLIASGRRNREIAGELAITVATVEAHLTRIYRKLHVRSRTELARVIRSA